MSTTNVTQVPVSAWAPLAAPVFRALWIAQLVSNLGLWMQTVGAQWLLVGDPNAAVLVSLVQTATTLPVMLLALPAGVLADLLDRRRMLIVTQTAMAACALLLSILTGAGLLTPTTLLTLLFLLGCGQALTAPAWQAIQPELVPREQIPAAAALSSLAMNAARAVGPAVAGVLVAASGPTLVFALNAVSFVGIVVVLIWWRRPTPPDTALPAERPFAAMGAGGRFVRNAPMIRRILLRSALFIVPASALWALLPVVASSELGMSSSGYGVLLGALGVGAVAGALGLGRLRAVANQNQLLVGSAVAFGAATLVLAATPPTWLLLPLLVVGGAGWLVTLSTLNSSMQLSLPGWVRARGLSAYLLIFMGGQAIGSALWGFVADTTSPRTALTASGVLLAVCALSVRWLPLAERTGQLDLAPAAHWPEPTLTFEPEPADGPVLVLKTYRVEPAQADAFLAAMARLGRSRLRTGAMQWQCYRNAEQPSTYVETFVVASWEEHLRQHRARRTVTDSDAEAAAERFAEGEPTIRHLIAVH